MIKNIDSYNRRINVVHFYMNEEMIPMDLAKYRLNRAKGLIGLIEKYLEEKENI